MIQPAPRIIVIDDEKEDLHKLTEGINRYGAACLPFHYPDDTEHIRPCPHVRVIFADLHLDETGASGNDKKHFGVIGGLISETIRPSGPYLLILWTKYAGKASSLRQFLDQRLKRTPAPKPLAVKAIDKKILFEDPSEDDPNIEKLVEEITNSFNQFPQIAALLSWEEMVLDAAGDTVSSIFGLVENNEQVSEILAHLAVGAVGRDHVENDRFHAVNEALLPILTDRIAAATRKDDQGIWQRAFDMSDIASSLSLEKAARLNRLVQIDPATDNGARNGSVIALPDKFLKKNFEKQFGLKQQEAALKQFFCKEPRKKLNWVLIQCQAICDYAQNKPGPLPYYLGLELPPTSRVRGTKPDALWTSPPFKRNGSTIYLHVNARFSVSLLPKFTKQKNVRYRLREQLLNDLIYRIHSYGSRPGMLRFQETQSSGR